MRPRAIARAPALAACLLCLGAEASLAGDPYKSMAKRFCRAASRAGISRVAVLPLRSVADGYNDEGTYHSERITPHMARCRRVWVVERAMLDAVLSEHSLGVSGTLDHRSLGRLGRMLQAEAVVSGTFAGVGDSVEINARLVSLETGVVLEARSARARRTYFASGPSAGAPAHRGYQGIGRPGWGPEPPRDHSDSPVPDAGDDRDICARAAERIDRLQAGILDLKARYWARQLQETPLTPGGPAVKPGAVIQDPSLRRSFHSLMREFMRSGPPPLTPAETKRFIEADSRAFLLHLRCTFKAEGPRGGPI